MQSLLMAASAAALLHSTMVTSGPLIPDGPANGPMPQNGVWALLPAACEAPTSLDLSTWAKCAVPIGFLDDVVAALEKPSAGKKATSEEFYSVARTKFTIAASGGSSSTPAPAVAQIVVPMVFSRSYYYLAIMPKTLDDTGHFAEARGWPVACAPKEQGGCNPRTFADVQAQAALEPAEPQRLYKLLRITVSSEPDGGLGSTPSSAAAPTPLTPPSGPVTSSPLAPPNPTSPS